MMQKIVSFYCTWPDCSHPTIEQCSRHTQKLIADVDLRPLDYDLSAAIFENIEELYEN
jgi:hypothetical protein